MNTILFQGVSFTVDCPSCFLLSLGGPHPDGISPKCREHGGVISDGMQETLDEELEALNG